MAKRLADALEVEEAEASAEAKAATPEACAAAIAGALTVKCPKCQMAVDPSPDGCIAMKCPHCSAAFCWLCFELCGSDAHPHAQAVHGGYFPSRAHVDQWHRSWRWQRVRSVLSRCYPVKCGAEAGASASSEWEAALSLSAEWLRDPAIVLWPFPSRRPPVHETSASLFCLAAHGARAALEAALEAAPEALEAVDERQMTLLMHAAHAGDEALVQLLLDRGANPMRSDERGRTAIELAQERGHLAVLTLLVRRYSTPRPTPLELCARGYTSADQAALVALIGSGQLCSLDLLRNRFKCETAAALAAEGWQHGVLLAGAMHDQQSLDLRGRELLAPDVLLAASDLRVSSTLTTLSLAANRATHIGSPTIGYARSMVGIEALCQAVLANATLSELDLSANELGPEGVRALIPCLGRRSLTALNLVSNQLDDETAQQLLLIKDARGGRLHTLCGLCPEQTSIALPASGLSAADATLLTHEMTMMGSLTTIDVSFNPLGEAAVLRMVRVLRATEGLKSLDLSGCCNLSQEASLQAVRDLIRESRALERLTLLLCVPSLDAALALVEVAIPRGLMLAGIERHTQEYAAFVEAGLQPPDAVLLASDLSLAKELRAIRIIGNRLGPQGGAALAVGIRQWGAQAAWLGRRLHVTIECNHLGDEGVNAIKQAMAVTVEGGCGIPQTPDVSRHVLRLLRESLALGDDADSHGALGASLVAHKPLERFALKRARRLAAWGLPGMCRVAA